MANILQPKRVALLLSRLLGGGGNGFRPARAGQGKFFGIGARPYRP